MKRINKTATLLLLSTSLFVLGMTNFKPVNAESSKLEAGQNISVSNINGNLNNVNIKFQFTSNVILDGENNALLVGLAASDGTVLTDERFIGVASSTVFDKDGVALAFKDGKVPSVIGAKSGDAAPYTYSFESKDFTVKDGSKDIAKLVVIGQKGAEINAEVSISEVKYSVKFGNSEAVSYSYNELISVPQGAPEYVYDIDGHQAITGWTDGDSQAFETGVSKATKDLVYSPVSGAVENHTWNHVNEVAATANSLGVKAHEECSCGAKKLATDSTVLATDADLRIELVNHVHDFEVVFNWEGTEPGDKPEVSYTCKVEACGHYHELTDSEIAVAIKEGSNNPASCTAAGSVTYVATATYEEVVKTSEHAYTLDKRAHTLTHHEAKAQSLEEDGCIEHWTCSECNGYFKDEACTQATTADAVKLAKYTLESPQYVSIRDLNGTNGESIPAKSVDYSYSLDTQPTYKSTVFVANLKYNQYVLNDDQNGEEGSQIYITTSNNSWNAAGYIWLKSDRVHMGITDDQGKISGNTQNMYEQALEIGKTYSIEYGRLAIMDGNTFTGKYYVYFSIDGKVINSLQQKVESKCSDGGIIHVTGKEGYTYYDAYTLETPKVISVSDLQQKDKSIGVAAQLSNGNEFTFNNDDHTENYSLEFNFLLYSDDPDNSTERQFHFYNASTEANIKDIKWSGLTSMILKKSSAHLGKGTTTLKKDVSWNNSEFSMAADTTYTVSFGRKAILYKGQYTGKYYSYLIVNNNLIKGESQIIPLEYAKGNNLFTTGNIEHGGKMRMLDVSYTTLQFEEADIISVNDLAIGQTYNNGEMGILAHNTYSYRTTTEYGSVIFKGTFNFTNYTGEACQVRFDSSWDNPGMVWFHGKSDVGLLYFDDAGQHSCKWQLPTNKDVNVEYGRLAIMNADGSFSGKHYFFLKFDGKYVLETVVNGLAEEKYTSGKMFFTGNQTLTGNVIKNVEIPYTVTLKVNGASQDVTVLQSGLVTIPSFDPTTQLGGEDMRIVGWTIEGTETKFNPLTDRIYDDISIVATISNEYLITFEGTEVIPVVPGEAIVLPTTNPTKAYDETNHYVFDCWVDANGNPFVAGTLSTGDATYTARFTTVAHVYGEWQVTVAETCTTAGSKKHVCECGHEVVETIPAAHKLVKHEALAATCTVAGNIEYYECSECHKLFSDANGSNEITAEIAVPAHGLVHHDAKNSTCTAQGNIEYWECTTCHKYYKDANATQEASEAELIVAPAHHLSKVEAKAATCEADGNIEYYHCSECNKNFKDSEGKNVVSNVKVAATGHTYGDDHKCTVCGKEDPDYVPEDEEPEDPEEPEKGCFGGAIPSILGLITLVGALLVSKKRKQFN